MISRHQGKAFIRVKALYLILKSDIGTYPEETDLEISDDFSETWEKVVAVDNTSFMNVNADESQHGLAYPCTVDFQLNKDQLATTQKLNLFKSKDLLCLVEDFHGNVSLLGDEEHFCRLSWRMSKGSTNMYNCFISTTMTHPPFYYTGTITSA